MTLQELGSNPVTMAQALAYIHDSYMTLLESGWMSTVLVAILAILIIRYRDGLVEKFDYGKKYASAFLKSIYIYVASFGERRKMRKSREKEVHDWFKDMLVANVDKAVEDEKITATEANELYAQVASIRNGSKRIFDDLRGFMFTPASVKEAIEERRRNEDRDAKGDIVPAPLPKESKLTTIKRMMSFKTKTA